MNHTIDTEKLEQVAAVFNAGTGIATTDKLLVVLEAAICADWHEENHQAWLDGVDAQEIAGWLASFLGVVAESEDTFAGGE